MRKSTFQLAIAAAALLAGASACVDDNYDLSDIDTTVRVEVRNLTLPMHLDPIIMEDIIKLQSDGKVQIIDGKYTVIQDGKITSSDVKIDPVHINAPTIATVTDVIDRNGVPAPDEPINFTLKVKPSAFNFVSDDITTDIVDVTRVNGEMSITFNLKITNVSLSTFKITDVKIAMPKGMLGTTASAGSYSPSTGIWSIPALVTSGNTAKATITIKGFDLQQMEAKVFTGPAHNITMDSNVELLDGTLTVNPADITSPTIPEKAEVMVSYVCTDFDAETIDGTIQYPISSVDIADVDITGIPAVLSQQGTDIRLADPRIYIQANNPLQSDKLVAQTGLKITAYHEDGSKGTFAINNPYFTIGGDNPAGVYNYCLAPAEPQDIDPVFAPAEFVPFTSLSDVFSGNGIPSRLGIDLVDPKIPTQKVTNFRVGENYGCVNGKYSFIAPIEMKQGSVIVYTSTEDGWASEDLDHLTITRLDVTLRVTTDVPMEIELSGYPIDEQGHQIDGVTITSAKVPAMAKNEPVKLSITGAITGLNGLTYKAVITQGADTEPLSPSMSIQLSDIRPTASGYYEKEL